jgi:hypothetical protein
MDSSDAMVICVGDVQELMVNVEGDPVRAVESRQPCIHSIA